MEKGSRFAMRARVASRLSVGILIAWLGKLLSSRGIPIAFAKQLFITIASDLNLCLASQKVLQPEILHLSHFLLPNVAALSAPKKNESSTYERTLMLPNSKLIVYSALPVTSGYVFVRIRRIVPSPGMLIGRVASQGKCMFSSATT